MLILTRHPGQSLHIGDEVTVTVIDITRRGVRIGIDAPREISVHREEIYLRIQAEGVAHEEIHPEDVVVEPPRD